MRTILLSLALLAPLPALAQTTPTPKLPPANPLPYEDVDAAQVMAPIQRLFAALTAKNLDAMLAEVSADGRATGVAEGRTSSRPWAQFLPGLAAAPQRFEERLVGTPAIEVDGDVAMVWVAYTFHIDGKLSHCGTDHFDMIRDGGRWKILNLTWTERSTGCPGQ